MNRIIMMGCMSVCVVSLLCLSTQQAYAGAGLYTELSKEQMIFALGSIQTEGRYKGIRTDEFTDSMGQIFENPLLSTIIPPLLLDNLHLSPLIGTIRFIDIANITVIPQQTIESDDPIEILDEINTFKDAHLIINEGMFLMGTTGKTIHYAYSHPSCLSGFISFPFQENNEISSYFCLSDTISSASISYQDEYLFLYPFSENYTLSITSSTTDIQWNEQDVLPIFLLKNTSYSIQEQGFFHLLPLNDNSDGISLTMNLEPANQPPDILTMVNQIPTMGDEFNMESIPFLSNNNQANQLITSLSSMLNGGIILTNHTGIAEIDDTQQQFQQFGFTRVDQAIVTVASKTITIQADSSLVFLGNHFYSSQAPNSGQGVSVPLLPIILWVCAITLLILFAIFHITRDIKFEINDKRIQRLAKISHLLGYVAAFILIDLVLAHQIGISLFTEISLNGFTLVAGIFLFIQLLLWTIGLFFVALPLGIVASKIGTYFGFDKTYQHGFKSLTALSIWPLISFYLTLFLNVVLLFFNPFNAMI